jgi:hypothetical protein
MFRVLSLLTLAVALALPLSTASAVEETHTLIRLDLSSSAGTEFVRQHAGLLDVIMAKPGHHAEAAASARALKFLRDSGHPFEIVQENLEASLAYANKGVGFGIYHTWSENIAFVDSLRLLYPEVVSAKWSIGQTVEGRDIWAFRVSANPDVDENEPEIFIDGMHHCREIMASEFPIMFAEHLATNYGTDPEITWLLDHRELYIVPVVNPDGFVYNELNNPNGGGMWRKNRRNNGDGTIGVDLNRNYPFQWGYDDLGSSPVSSDITYRGPGPASELETQAMMEFINSREFRTHDSVHTYSNLLLYPWGYNTTPTPDDAVFDHMAAEMTKFNGYQPGQPGDVLYDVNGGSFDWNYGDETKHTRLYTFSSEIGGGSDGFWPLENRRQQLFQENIWPHIYLMRVAGTWVAAHTPVVLNAAKSILPGQSADLSFTLENQSVYDSILGLDLTVKTDDPWVQLGAAERAIGSLASLASTDLSGDPLPITVDPGCPNGHRVNFMVVLHLADGDLSYPLSFTVGTPAVIATDNFETGTSDWTLADGWAATTTAFHSATHSLTDSPAGNYSDLSAPSATLNLSLRADRLQFWHRYAIEDGWDYGRVQVGSDGVWKTVASYTGNQSTWQLVDLDLSNEAGANLQVRFVLETDQSVVADGWYIDDVTILGDPDGDQPAPPLASAPLGGASIPGDGLLVVNNSTHPQGGNLVYGFRVYSDVNCTQLVAGVDDVTEESNQTSWALPDLADGTYYWRAWAGGPGLRSDLSAAELFAVNNGSAASDLALDQLNLRVLDGIADAQARLQLTLPGRRDVSLEIYDTRGARVRRLHTGSMDAGTRVLVWDGRDRSGRAAASGVYFVRLVADRQVRTGRVVLVR